MSTVQMINPAPVTTPVISAEVVATAPAMTPQPVVAVEVPVVAPVVTPAVQAPVSVSEAPAVTETVLGEQPKVEPPPPVEPVVVAPVEGEQPVKEEGQSDEPAPPPTYEPFTLPEGITLEEERVKEFTSILSDFEGKTKAEHAFVQEFGQKAVDFHVAEVQRTVEAMQTQMNEEWENTKKTWKESFMSDPELGGNRWQTTVDSALNFIRTHGGNETQQNEFRELMNKTGIGNHPAMIRLLANAGVKMSEGVPLVANTPLSAPKSKVTTMYGKQS